MRNPTNSRRWTPEEDDRLWMGWVSDDAVEVIAKRLKRSIRACYNRAAILKIPGKTTGPNPKAVLPEERNARMREKVAEAMTGRPECVRTRDEEYVAACLAQGGFVTAVRIDGKTVHVKPRIAA